MKRICVFSGSSIGALDEYARTATSLGRELARRGIGVVYGAASIGLMGCVADGALEEGGEVIGIIPEALVMDEVVHRGLTELKVVASMHERKALMAQTVGRVRRASGGLRHARGAGGNDHVVAAPDSRQALRHSERP